MNGQNENVGILEQLLEQNPLIKSGVKTVQRVQDQQIQEAMQQGVPASHILQQLITQHTPKNAITSGNVTQNQQGGIDIQKAGWLNNLLGKIVVGGDSVTKDLENMGIASNIQQKQKTMGNVGLTSLSTLSPENQVNAYALARKIAGVRGAQNILPSIVTELNSGKTIDQVEDTLRYSGQSVEFTGSLRKAAQQITVGKSASDQQTAFDTLDDLQGDSEQQKEYLKRMAVVNAPIDQRNTVMGKERTIGLLNEIEGDLNTLEKNGISTGFFSGNYENLLARVGQVKSPEMRRIATKIAVAVINYRRAMTGVQFGQIENREYKILFPNINKVGNFNTAAIKGLREVFTGDVDTFYSQSMGSKNYKELFGKENKEQAQDLDSWTKEKEARYQELLKKRGK